MVDGLKMPSYNVNPNGRRYEVRWHDGRMRLVHVLVWEQAHGPKPPGFDIHHKDDDSLNNDLSNLELLSKVDHQRTGSPYWRRSADGEWEQQCRICREWKPVDAYSLVTPKDRPRSSPRGQCRPCRTTLESQRKQKRRSV